MSLLSSIKPWSRPFNNTPNQTSEWKRGAALAAVGAVGAAVGVLSYLQLYSRFPRGLRSRSPTSRPFPSDYSPPPSVAHQFYTTEDYQFIRLSQGCVRYILRGQIEPGKQVVVLVHGFSIAAEIWKQQSDYLAAQGYTVLSFDNYGRGWSDAPDLVLDEHVYVGQLAELLFALGIHTPITLVGVSMGGAIVASFAARFPQSIARLCMVCPAGLPIATPTAMSSIMKRPLLGPFLFKRAIPHMQERGAAAQWQWKDSDEYKAWGQFGRQNAIEHDGFIRTLYRTVVDYPMTDQRHNYELLNKIDHLPILIIWGDKDGLTPYSNGPILASILRNSQLVTVVDARHNFLIERPQPISETLAAWISDDKKKLPSRIRDSIKDNLDHADQQEGQASQPCPLFNTKSLKNNYFHEERQN